MRLYLTGEGATDFGNIYQEQYQPGPLALLAKPKSEAWILCALNGYQHCAALENESGNDDSPNSLKIQLEQRLQQPPNRELLNQIVEQTPIDLNQIDMPMLNQFKQDCINLLARLGFR